MSKLPSSHFRKQGDTRPVRKPSVALALGGGGARGLAHILMLEVFDELKLRPSLMAGTSIGAIFAAAYASGLTAKQIRAHTEEILTNRTELIRQLFTTRSEPIQRVLNVLQLRSALLKPEALLDLILPTRVACAFEDLEQPLHIVASDFYTQDEVIFSSGDLRAAIAASMALPVLFKPVTIGDYALMDGGLVNPLPFDVISDQADLVVAIDVSGAGRIVEDRKPPSAFEAAVASSQIFQNSIVREKLRARQPDILIDVDVGDFHVLDFFKIEKVLAAAEPAKHELREKLQRVLGAETLSALEAPPKP